jgi:hypothetical protein
MRMSARTQYALSLSMHRQTIQLSPPSTHPTTHTSALWPRSPSSSTSCWRSWRRTST